MSEMLLFIEEGGIFVFVSFFFKYIYIYSHLHRNIQQQYEIYNNLISPSIQTDVGRRHPHACLYNIFLTLTIYTSRYQKIRVVYHSTISSTTQKGYLSCRGVNCRDLKLAFPGQFALIRIIKDYLHREQRSTN